MKIALVLGSGGARGYAHIGVVRELESRGHEIVAVSGSSMGALVGGLYVAEGLDDFEGFARELSRAAVLRYADVAVHGPGLIRASKIMGVLEDMVGEVRIEQLRMPFTAVAADLERRREVWMREGLLIPAIRASIAIPTIFTPVRLDGRLLVDGGVLNPLPIEPLLDVRADLIVGVSLFGRSRLEGRSAPDHAASASASDRARGLPRLPESLLQKLPTLTAPGLPGIPGLAGGEREPGEAPMTVAEMLSTALDVMQGQIELGRTSMNRPDVGVSVPTDVCEVYDFHEANRVIDVGRELAVKAFDEAGI